MGITTDTSADRSSVKGNYLDSFFLFCMSNYVIGKAQGSKAKKAEEIKEDTVQRLQISEDL